MMMSREQAHIELRMMHSVLGRLTRLAATDLLLVVLNLFFVWLNWDKLGTSNPLAPYSVSLNVFSALFCVTMLVRTIRAILVVRNALASFAGGLK